MLSATLDTSCAQNFLTVEESPDLAVVEVIEAALRGRIDVKVTDEAYSEVERTADPEMRRRRLERLKVFGRLRVPVGREGERDHLANQLHEELFPRARQGTRENEHNLRDCRQLAAHSIIGRKVFVTRDRRLLRAADKAMGRGIVVLDPAAAAARVRPQTGPSRTPAIAVRDAQLDADEAEIRGVLAPLARDYPNFDAWLTGALKKPDARVRLGLLADRVAAVALSTTKDSRVVKLSAFYVAPFAQQAGLGGHLLWSELRAWERERVEKVYVTVSSRHADLVRFFVSFGFLVEGLSPRRYQDQTAEFVLGKHFVRERVSDSELGDFADRLARVVFSVPEGASMEPTGWSLYPDAPHPTFLWERQGAEAALVSIGDGRELRRWGVLDLERIFYPLRLALAQRRVLLVPIEPQWADALLEHAGQQRSLTSDPASERLLLRADNAYFCYPKALAQTLPGTPILFYVAAPVSAVVGEARVLACDLGMPEELFRKYGDVGIYRLPQIASHAMKRGPRAGKALALRFGLYVPFPTIVSAAALQRLVGRRLVPQGLNSIGFEEFELIRRTGGLEW